MQRVAADFEGRMQVCCRKRHLALEILFAPFADIQLSRAGIVRLLMVWAREELMPGLSCGRLRPGRLLHLRQLLIKIEAGGISFCQAYHAYFASRRRRLCTASVIISRA
jgi:hypothetical protein